MTKKISDSSGLMVGIASGDTLEIDPGNYLLKSAKFSRSDTVLVAADPKKPPVIYMAPNHPGGPMLQGYDLGGIGFENVILDGNFSRQTGAIRGRSPLVLCYLEDCSEIHMEGCTVQNSAADALKIRHCKDIHVKGNQAHDLGHEFVYALSNCLGLTVEHNVINIRTNSAVRLSGGCTGFDISHNTITTGPANPSTGPAFEIDKGPIAEGDIGYNDVSNILGAGVWAIGNGGSCKNVIIHDNTFTNVGRYAKDNGYSNGCFTGAGFDGLIFENNTIIGAPNGVLMNEWEYGANLARTKYEWIFRNNIMKDVAVGFLIDIPRGSVSGDGNTLTNIKQFSKGHIGNVHVNGKETTEDVIKVDVPETNKVKILGQFKCTVNLTTEDGRKYNTTATANVTKVEATGTGKKVSGYFRLKDMDTQEELHVPFEGELQKGLF